MGRVSNSSSIARLIARELRAGNRPANGITKAQLREVCRKWSDQEAEGIDVIQAACAYVGITSREHTHD